MATIQTQYRKKKRPYKDPAWLPAFISALEESGNISFSARAAKISPCNVLSARKNHPEIEAKVQEALAISTSNLEEEARRRAIKGVKKDIYYQGVKCGEEYNYSDTLLIFLLKAANPEKYRERYTAEITGKVEVDLASTLNAARARLAKSKTESESPAKEG